MIWYEQQLQNVVSGQQNVPNNFRNVPDTCSAQSVFFFTQTEAGVL